MVRTGLLALALAVGAALVAAPAEAQWKWRDKSGHIQYSDLPPPSSVPQSDILQQPSAARRAPAPAIPAAAASGSSAPAPSRTDPELEAKRKAAEQQQAAKQKAEEEKNAQTRASNCSQARLQMKTLQEGVRIARTNAQGEREVLDDEGRAEEIKNTQAIIDSNCR